jgi:hypothetical protein
MRKGVVRTFTVAVCGLVMTQFYQNCGQIGQFDLASQTGSLNQSSSILPDTSHPAAKEVVAPTQHVLVHNKVWVAALLRDIFARSANDSGLEGLINQWILYKPAQFGGSCNPYDTYSQRDCGGDVSNANLPLHTDDNTVRESFRLQFCENTLGYDDFVNSVLAKINKTAMAPDSASIASIYSLFYRDGDIDTLTLNSLIELDHSLAKNSESVIERWRAVILQVCESPGWQLE